MTAEECPSGTENSTLTLCHCSPPEGTCTAVPPKSLTASRGFAPEVESTHACRVYCPGDSPVINCRAPPSPPVINKRRKPEWAQQSLGRALPERIQGLSFE